LGAWKNWVVSAWHDHGMPTVVANGIDLYYDRFGESGDPVLLLINGLGSQCIRYDDELCEAFVDRYLQVIRFDNRDVGLSTHLPDDATYALADMAADATGLLDALAIERAHVWGCSMGGMIAQTLAIEHPQRVASLTSIMSTTGERSVGQASPEIVASLMELSVPTDDLDVAVERAVANAKAIGSPGEWDEEWQRRRQRTFVARAYDPAGVGRQIAAVMASPHRAEGLARLEIPTLVIHGDVDPLIDVSGGRRSAELVPGAELLVVEGMGHDLPPFYWSPIVEATTQLVISTL
jgi:pimeloyl-ACP methyl ester carboxylesterase